MKKWKELRMWEKEARSFKMFVYPLVTAMVITLIVGLLRGWK